jgi:stage II sporulation protein R
MIFFRPAAQRNWQLSPSFRKIHFWMSLLLLFILGAMFIPGGIPGSLAHATYIQGEQEGQEELKIEEIIRFHVKAHSNNPEDQEIKNYLARNIINIYRPLWEQCGSMEELRLLISANRKEIERTARKILQQSGSPHDVQVSLGKSIFPARFYEGKLFPPGEYEALYIIIGEGTGENWWCVLFPPLCLNLVVPNDDDNLTADAKFHYDEEELEVRFWLWEFFFEK